MNIHIDSFIKPKYELDIEDPNHTLESFCNLSWIYFNKVFENNNIDPVKHFPVYMEKMDLEFRSQDTLNKDLNIYKLFHIKNRPYIIVTVIKLSKEFVFHVYIDLDKIKTFEKLNKIKETVLL